MQEAVGFSQACNLQQHCSEVVLKDLQIAVLIVLQFVLKAEKVIFKQPGGVQRKRFIQRNVGGSQDFRDEISVKIEPGMLPLPVIASVVMGNSVVPDDDAAGGVFRNFTIDPNVHVVIEKNEQIVVRAVEMVDERRQLLPDSQPRDEEIGLYPGNRFSVKEYIHGKS